MTDSDQKFADRIDTAERLLRRVRAALACRKNYVEKVGADPEDPGDIKQVNWWLAEAAAFLANQSPSRVLESIDAEKPRGGTS